jgi:hypothetical protein
MTCARKSRPPSKPDRKNLRDLPCGHENPPMRMSGRCRRWKACHRRWRWSKEDGRSAPSRSPPIRLLLRGPQANYPSSYRFAGGCIKASQPRWHSSSRSTSYIRELLSGRWCRAAHHRLDATLAKAIACWYRSSSVCRSSTIRYKFPR